MLDVFNTPTPQNANYQEFVGGGSVRDWLKPRGASMVRFLLIGSGGGGAGADGSANGGGGGGSGSITTWIGPAIFIPDVLRIVTGAGGVGGAATLTDGANGNVTQVVYQLKNGTGYILLSASGGSGGTSASGTGGSGGTTTAGDTDSTLRARGIFNTVAGQNGSNDGVAVSASSTTFLSGGSGGATTTGGSAGSVSVNYGYPSVSGGAISGGAGQNGYFFSQPILISAGGAGGGGNAAGTGGKGGNGGLGCGGGGGGTGSTAAGAGGNGGDGAVFVWAW